MCNGEERGDEKINITKWKKKACIKAMHNKHLWLLKCLFLFVHKHTHTHVHWIHCDQKQQN